MPEVVHCERCGETEGLIEFYAGHERVAILCIEHYIIVSQTPRSR